MAGIGSRCPKCGGGVRPAGSLEYRCVKCGATFDSADLFLH